MIDLGAHFCAQNCAKDKGSCFEFLQLFQHDAWAIRAPQLQHMLLSNASTTNFRPWSLFMGYMLSFPCPNHTRHRPAGGAVLAVQPQAWFKAPSWKKVGFQWWNAVPLRHWLCPLTLARKLSWRDFSFLQATFEVDLTYPPGMVALSNTAPLPSIVRTQNGLQHQWHEATPLMSTYLLAICIGHVVSQTATTGMHMWLRIAEKVIDICVLEFLQTSLIDSLNASNCQQSQRYFGFQIHPWHSVVILKKTNMLLMVFQMTQ